MADESAGEKTETPTDKKRQDTRQKGNVAKSTEINSVLVLFASCMMLQMFGPWIFRTLAAEIVMAFNLVADPHMETASIVAYCDRALVLSVVLLLPIAGGIMVAGILANVIQVGFLFTGEPLIPKLEKIDPIAGFKRMFGMRSLVELIKSLAKLAIIGFVAYLTIKGRFNEFAHLSDTSVQTIWWFLCDVIYSMLLRVTITLCIMAILDYLWQRFDYEKRLRMSHEEIKQERKQMDGDPQIKARIRSLQREMARRRMMEEVPKATVVVTNPTHLAIALRYEPSEMSTPKVLAKGKLLIAAKIKARALELGIPVVEDKPLARAMYDKVEAGDDIPMEFFTAVAEIMAYVYRLKKTRYAA